MSKQPPKRIGRPPVYKDSAVVFIVNHDARLYRGTRKDIYEFIKALPKKRARVKTVRERFPTNDVVAALANMRMRNILDITS